MRILFVLEYYYPHIGGVEKLFKSLAESLVSNGNVVMVLTNRYKHDLAKRELVNGVEIRRLRFYNRFFFTFFSIPCAVKHGRNADIIHTTSFNAAIPAYIAARWNRKKVLITFHEAWEKLWFKLPFINPVLRYLFYAYEGFILKLSFTKFIAVSDATKYKLIDLGVDQEKVHRIYNGLDYGDFEKFKHKPPTNFVLTYFGRLGPSKGLDILLPATEQFLSENPKAVCKLIIPREEDLAHIFVKNFLNNSKVKNQIQVFHELDAQKLFNEISHSSCVVIPSYSEGFCFAAAECVAMGVPIISSNQAALKEVVSGKYILMDSLKPDSLHKALEKAQNGEWSEKTIKRFTIDNFIKDYLKLYEF